MEEKKIVTIPVVDTLKLLWKDKKWMCLYVFIGAILGLIVAFSIPNTYKTKVILAPEDSDNGFSGSISSLASMVGMDMNLGLSGDAIYPEIYPDVLGSTDFQVSLFSVPVTTKDGSYTADYATYLHERYRIPWWEYPKNWIGQGMNKLKGDTAVFRGKKQVDPFRLTKPEWELTKLISHNLQCQVDKKTNVITITLEDQDPYISACMADTVKNRLQVLITDYRTRKARQDVEYLEKIYTEARSQYVAAQHAYAAYADRYTNSMLESVNQQADRLKSEMELRENIYNTVAQQLQLARAKVQERTPVFTTLQSASVPVKKSNMSKALVLLIWMVLGFCVRCVVLACKHHELFLKQ